MENSDLGRLMTCSATVPLLLFKMSGNLLRKVRVSWRTGESYFRSCMWAEHLISFTPAIWRFWKQLRTWGTIWLLALLEMMWEHKEKKIVKMLISGCEWRERNHFSSDEFVGEDFEYCISESKMARNIKTQNFWTFQIVDEVIVGAPAITSEKFVNLIKPTVSFFLSFIVSR